MHVIPTLLTDDKQSRIACRLYCSPSSPCFSEIKYTRSPIGSGGLQRIRIGTMRFGPATSNSFDRYSRIKGCLRLDGDMVAVSTEDLPVNY